MVSEAPRKRPAQAVVLADFSAHIRARPADVFEAIAARIDPGPDAHSQFTADPRAHLVIAQGSWWYRAEYRIVADDHGCLVEHAIVNVAATFARWGSFTGRKVLARAPGEFERLMRQLRLELE